MIEMKGTCRQRLARFGFRSPDNMPSAETDSCLPTVELLLK